MNQEIAENSGKRYIFLRLALISLVIGVLIFLSMPISSACIIGYATDNSTALDNASVINTYLLVIFIINVIGFICGLLGLLSEKRGVAITGLFLCSLPLIPILVLII